MKLVLDEKLKNRLVGLAVLISLGAIFAPVLVRQSSQNLETTMNVRVTLPPKPTAPNVSIADKKEVFQTIKIAKVAIPDLSSEKALPKLAKAENIQENNVKTDESPQLAEKSEIKPEPEKRDLSESTKIQKKTILAEKKPIKVQPQGLEQSNKEPKISKVSAIKPKPVLKKEMYAVQLASFAKLSNAESLVNKLQAKGYKAIYTQVPIGHKMIYKVLVGHSPNKNEVMQLKTHLANAMQLSGLVVNTGVS